MANKHLINYTTSIVTKEITRVETTNYFSVLYYMFSLLQMFEVQRKKCPQFSNEKIESRIDHIPRAGSLISERVSSSPYYTASINKSIKGYLLTLSNIT